MAARPPALPSSARTVPPRPQAGPMAKTTRTSRTTPTPQQEITGTHPEIGDSVRSARLDAEPSRRRRTGADQAASFTLQTTQSDGDRNRHGGNPRRHTGDATRPAQPPATVPRVHPDLNRLADRNRRWVRTTLRQLDAKSRRRIVQHALFNVVRSLNKAAGAPVHHQRDHDEPNALRAERAAAGREAAREPVPRTKRRQNRPARAGTATTKNCREQTVDEPGETRGQSRPPRTREPGRSRGDRTTRRKRQMTTDRFNPEERKSLARTSRTPTSRASA